MSEEMTQEQKMYKDVNRILNHKLIKGENWISIGFKIGFGLSLWGFAVGFICLIGWVALISIFS